ADDPLQIKHSDGIDPGKRFVEQNECGIDAQAARNLHAPALSPGESISAVQTDVLQTKLVDEFFHLLAALMPRNRLSFQHRVDVFLDRPLAKCRRFYPD